MAGAYLATNIITSDAVITPSSEDESYPAENLVDRQAPNVFRCESTSTLTILIDVLSSLAADTIAIINHNLSASATLSLKADNSSPPTTPIAVPTYREFDIWKAFTLVSARYWQLEITDSAPENIAIGQLVIGSRESLPRARRIGRFRPAQHRENIEGETYAGVFWNYYLFDRKEFNPSFRLADETELEVFRTMDRILYGNIYPFCYIPEESGPDVYYVRKERSFEPDEVDKQGGAGDIVHDYAMTLVEESRGLNILE